MDIICAKKSSQKKERVEENINFERLPRCDSFAPFICGSIAEKSGIYNGCKV